MIIKAFSEYEMNEVRWIWKHWNTWETFHEAYENGDGVRGVYLGCLVLAKHYCKP